MSHVYVLINEYFPGLTKLGSTSDIGEICNQLRSILPGESTLVWSRECENSLEVEREVRSILSKFSIGSSKDWLSCPSVVVIEQFKIYLERIEGQSILESLQLQNKMKFSTLKELGEYCETIRKREGISQIAMAGICGVDTKFISELERGEPSCHFDLVIKVCNMIGLDFVAVKR